MNHYYQDKLVTIYHADTFKSWGEFSEAQFDCIVTDPPYWTLDKWRSVGTTTRLGGNNDPEKRSGWFDTIDEKELWELMLESHRLLKPNCHAYIMGDGQVLRWLLGYSEEAGFTNYKPLVWDKVNQGMGYHYRCRHEFFVMFDKGKNRKLNSFSTPDVWTVPMIRGGYPTEKPVAIMEIPILHSTQAGELVFDPFMGGGSLLVAAQRHGRRAIGIDKSEEACEIAAKRLSNVLELI